MKNLILIVTLLFTVQSFARDLNSELTVLKDKLAFFETLPQGETETKTISNLKREIENIERSIALSAYLKQKENERFNAEIDKKIAELDKLDLNVNDLCVDYIKRYELEKNQREVTLERTETINKSCHSRWTITTDTPEIPVVTHQELIEYFDADIKKQKSDLEKSKK